MPPFEVPRVRACVRSLTMMVDSYVDRTISVCFFFFFFFSFLHYLLWFFVAVVEKHRGTRDDDAALRTERSGRFERSLASLRRPVVYYLSLARHRER